MCSKMAAETHGKTIFVRNLPFSATKENVEDLFSTVGPVKNCFVVKSSDGELNKGYGYVTYSLKEDAEAAVKKPCSLEGRKLALSFANKKPKKVKEKKQTKEEKDEGEEEESSDEEAKEPSPSKVSKTPTATTEAERLRKKKVHEERVKRKSVIVDDLPAESIEKLVKETKNVTRTEFPTQMGGAAVVEYKSRKDAMKAVRKLKALGSEDKPVSARLLKEVLVNLKETKESRLIVRNVSFKCKAEDLKKAFSSFGKVLDAVIPLKPDGKMFGFGFVQFSNVGEATKAMKKMNGQALQGRPVAVDWAVPKSKFQQQSKASAAVDSDSDSSSSDSEDAPVKPSKTKPLQAQKEESEDSSEDEMETEEEEDMEVEHQSDSEEESENENETESDSGNDSEMDSASDSDTDSEKADKKKIKKNQPGEKSDTDDGKTVFIRNLSFVCEEDQLQEAFEEYGDILFARVVMDSNTGHSRGTAFIKFKSSASAEKCVQKADEESGIVLDGRRLNITIAVSRERAEKLQQKRKDAKKDDNKDGRNLWLAREGLIRPGTQGAVGLTKEDLMKRAKVEQIKREKLKNPNVFISTTRLCVRNIPTRIDDAHLRKIYQKAVGDKTAVISECRIMRDLANVNANGKAKSRGYAFVEFSEHKHALAALRNTNNNPEMFGEKKRLIVEFSLENKAALNAKEKRLERNKAKTEMLQKGRDSYVTKGRQKKDRAKKPERDLLDDDDEDSVAEKKKGQKNLPSHTGPKIRHKARPALPKKKADKVSRQDKRQSSIPEEEESPTKKRSRSRRGSKRVVSDDFDQLVSKYTQRITGAIQQPAPKRAKWFRD